MKHRIFLCVIFLFCLLFLLATPDAQAAERWEEGWNADITYEFDAATGTVTLSGTGEITVDKSYKPWGNYPKEVKKVVIGEGITGIGAYAFERLQELTEVVLPKSVTTIGRSAFRDCDALTGIDISHVTFLDQYAFSSCNALTAVDISSITSLGDYAFQDCALRSVTIPKGITVIPRGAFMNCNKLSELVLHDQITKIGYDAFNDCYQLASLKMPKGLKELDDYAFADCIRLTEIQLNEGLEIIGRGALSGCTVLERLVIPDSVSVIRDDAFRNSKNLQSIHFGANLSSVTYTPFQECVNLTTFTISKNNPYYEVHNNGLYTKDPRQLVVIAPGYAGAHVVPEGTVAIGPNACYGGKITSLTVPGTVKIIDEYAFADCKKLKTVSLGDGIEEIEMRAFTRSGITEITFPASIKKLGGEVLAYCTSLTKVIFNGLPPEVGDGVPEIKTVDVYYPGYLSEWKTAALHSIGFYINYIPDCMGRHDLRWEVIKAPTCKETGWRSETWCVVCRETVDPEGALPLADHSFGPWTTVTSPTTEKEGLSKRTCNTCTAFEQKAIPKQNPTTEPPATEPSAPPQTEPSQPVISEPPEENPSEPPATLPSEPSSAPTSAPDNTEPTTPSAPVPTEPDTQEKSSPSLWISVVTIAAVSILIGMVTAFVIFALKKKKSKG